MKTVAPHGNERPGFTLLELLVVVSIVALLVGLAFPVYQRVLASTRATASGSNLRQLVAANMAYVADHAGSYCPAMDSTNLYRWHGARTSGSGKFDPTKGYLSPYLGREGRIETCPLFLNMLKGAESFEDGSGGYGYNEIYIGGTPQDNFTPNVIARVPHPSRTVMFTTTAFSMADGMQEYPFCEPYQWVDPNNQLSGDMQPSVHFRANGRALVAWCDGHLTAELPARLGGNDYYGGDSKQDKIGWFGPEDNNGYWNPDYQGP